MTSEYIDMPQPTTGEYAVCCFNEHCSDQDCPEHGSYKEKSFQFCHESKEKGSEFLEEAKKIFAGTPSNAKQLEEDPRLSVLDRMP